MNKLLHCDALTGLADVPDESISLVVTSPPWGKTRLYGWHEFDFEPIASELWRVIQPGGVVCWHYQDQIEDGSLSCEHCEQLLYFRWLGFRVHETLTIVTIRNKPLARRHYRTVSQVYVLSKGRPAVVNRLQIVKNRTVGGKHQHKFRGEDGVFSRRMVWETRDYGYRSDVWAHDEDAGIWAYPVGGTTTCEDRAAINSRHGAIMPRKLAYDLIRTYSRPGSLVLDICGGTGTTGVAALEAGRRYLLFEPWDEAIGHARRRLANMAAKLGQPDSPEPTPPPADSGDDARHDG